MALANLDEIIATYGHDILGDDAMFLNGKVHEESLKDFESAQQIYNDFLLRYPGSVFTAEARKRFRKLRGDQVF